MQWSWIFDLGLQKIVSSFRPNVCQNFGKNGAKNFWRPKSKIRSRYLKNVAKIANFRPKIGQLPL